MKERFRILITAIFQVGLVNANIVFVSNNLLLLTLINAFFVALVWTFNVSKIAFSDIYDKIIYAIGSVIGTYIGWTLSHLLRDYILNGK